MSPAVCSIDSVTIFERGANLIEQQQGEVRYLQFSHYLQFPEITHGSFTRLGGYSKTPYWGLNVSYSTGDDFENVLRNRLRALQALHIEHTPALHSGWYMALTLLR